MGPVVKATLPDGTYGTITFDCAGNRGRVVQLERRCHDDGLHRTFGYQGQFHIG
jgi:hypothetical protein